jgi:LruC domain-containing protein
MLVRDTRRNAVREVVLARRLFVRATLALTVLGVAIAGPRFAAAETIHYPPSGDFATLLVEDSWPSAGDGDLNDVVLGFRASIVTNDGVSMGSIELTVYPQALGSGSVNSGLALRLPDVPGGILHSAEVSVDGGPPFAARSWAGEPELVFAVEENLREGLCGGANGFINTVVGEPEIACLPATLTIDFPEPPPLDPTRAPFDLFLFRSGDPSHQWGDPTFCGTPGTMDTSLFGTEDDGSVLPDGPCFITSLDVDPIPGLPFVIQIDEPADYPREMAHIDDAFPKLASFVASGGTEDQDWYRHPNSGYIYRSPSEVPLGPLVGPAVVVLALLSVTWMRRPR